MHYYIICKNEAQNIEKCIKSLLPFNSPISILDTGSTDQTIEIAKKYPVNIEAYDYQGHCAAYNDITTREAEVDCVILDADMELSTELNSEIHDSLKKADVVIANVDMYIEGQFLKWGSLYPPKPIAFRRGKSFFEPVGHGEKLKSGIISFLATGHLIHNDLKPYSSYLNTQFRYSEQLLTRFENKKLNMRDFIRCRTPLLIVLSPFFSLFFRLGILSRLGWIYSLDRLIAEAVMYRASLARMVSNSRNSKLSNPAN